MGFIWGLYRLLVDLSAQGTQVALAAIVGVTQPTISALGITTGTLGEMVLAYCRRMREQAAGRYTEGPLDLSQERAALARSQREGIDIKNAVLRGQYAPIELLSEILATASQSVTERFDHLPAVLRKTCPHLTDADRDQVVGVIAAARNEWVRATAELVAVKIETVEDGDEPELAGLEDADANA